MKSKIKPDLTSDELSFIENVKRLTTIAMFSDDDLMEMLVLKGGNAMDIIYGITERASIDLDFSMSLDFKEGELAIIEVKIIKALQDTFSAEGYTVFDVKFLQRPQKVVMAELFWGGYRVNFKLIENGRFEESTDSLEFLRRNARVIGVNGKKTFQIDISKFEYCDEKVAEHLDGYTIYVYTPKMIVFEKVRAICQQMPEYKKIITTIRQTPRARDFFDIYMLLSRFTVDLYSEDSIGLLKTIFEIKKVPLELLHDIHKHRDYHRLDFDSLRDTVRGRSELKAFDFYFDYVVDKFGGIT